jgi:hypothetical protein
MKLGERRKENKVPSAVIKSILELLDGTAEDEAFHRLKRPNARKWAKAS